MMNQDKKTADQETTIKPSTDRRSEEVTDIIERMPVGWTRLVVAIIMLVVLVTVSLGCIIKYPDTVMGQISITGEKSPVRLVASSPVPLRLQRKGFSISIFNAIDKSTIKEMTTKPDMAIAHHRC